MRRRGITGDVRMGDGVLALVVEHTLNADLLDLLINKLRREEACKQHTRQNIKDMIQAVHCHSTSLQST